MKPRPQVLERIDAALEKMLARKMAVRAIYLDPADDAAFVQANTRYWRKALGSRATFFVCHYKDHILRQGERSIIYSTQGVGVAIPKALSYRTREKAA